MTVTLACIDNDGKGWIGADSCASDSISHSIVRNDKCFHPVGRNDIVIGCAGTFRLPNLLQYIPGVFPSEEELSTEEIDMSYLVNEFIPLLAALTEDFEDDDVWELLLAVNKKVYRVQMDLSIVESSGNADAIGMGGMVALGAFKVLNELKPEMTVEDKIRFALDVACNSCQGCMPPFNIVGTENTSTRSVEEGTVEKSPRKSCYTIVRHKEDDNKPKKKRKRKITG